MKRGKDKIDGRTEGCLVLKTLHEDDDDDDDESCSLTMRHAGKYVTQRKVAASLACVFWF